MQAKTLKAQALILTNPDLDKLDSERVQVLNLEQL